MDPRLANLVSLSAARIDLDFVSDKRAKDDTAPRPVSLEGLNFGLFLPLFPPDGLPLENACTWIVDKHDNSGVVWVRKEYW